jgi:hypothetical protein
MLNKFELVNIMRVKRNEIFKTMDWLCGSYGSFELDDRCYDRHMAFKNGFNRAIDDVEDPGCAINSVDECTDDFLYGYKKAISTALGIISWEEDREVCKVRNHFKDMLCFKENDIVESQCER